MNYRPVDTLNPDQLEPGDLISFKDSEPVLIHSIDILSNGCQINYLDDFGDEMLSETLTDDDTVILYVYDDDD